MGLGVSSQLITINNFMIFLGTLGIPTGLAKNISQWEIENEKIKIAKVLGSSIILIILIGIFISINIVLFNDYLSVLLFGDNQYNILIILISLSFPFASLCAILESYLRGLKNFSFYVKLSIIFNIISLIISGLLVYIYGVSGVAIAIFVSSIIGLLIYIYYLNKKKILYIVFPKNIHEFFSDGFKNLLSWGVASLIIGFSDNLTLLTIRSIIINNAGLEANGIYQVVVSISNNYISVFFMAVSIYIIPVFAGIKIKSELNNEINTFFRLTIFIILPIISFTFIFREILIVLLYSSEFISASKLFIYSFLGDFFKALSWVLGVWLIPFNKLRSWIIIGVLYNINYLLFFLFFYFILDFSIESTVIGYMITNIITFVINYFYLIKKNDFTFKLENQISLWSSLIILLILIVISDFNIIWGYIIIAPVILIWLYINITKEEYLNIKNNLIQNLSKKDNV